MVPQVWLTEDDIRRMMEVATHIRDKCLIFCCYEAGTRAGELLGLRWRDVEFDKMGATLTVKGKTGMRSIPIVCSAPLLAQWREQHPHRDDPKAFVWITYGKRASDKPLAQATFNYVLRLLAIRAKEDRPKEFKHDPRDLHAHILRHSRATELARRGWTEAQLCAFFGWRFGSKMPAVYIKHAAMASGIRD